MSGLSTCPGVLKVKDIQRILKIGQVAAYRLIHSGAFPVIKVGHSYRIPEEEFYNWMRTNRGPIAASVPLNFSSLLAAGQRTTAVVDNSCILSQLKNGGLDNGR